CAAVERGTYRTLDLLGAVRHDHRGVDQVAAPGEQVAGEGPGSVGGLAPGAAVRGDHDRRAGATGALRPAAGLRVPAVAVPVVRVTVPGVVPVPRSMVVRVPVAGGPAVGGGVDHSFT